MDEIQVQGADSVRTSSYIQKEERGIGECIRERFVSYTKYGGEEEK